MVFSRGNGTHLPDCTFWIEPDELDTANLSLEQKGPLRHCSPSNSWVWLNRPQAAKGLPRKQDDAKAGWSLSIAGVLWKTAGAPAKHDLLFLQHQRQSTAEKTELTSSLPQQWRQAATHPCLHVGLGMAEIFQGCQKEQGATAQPPQQSWQWVQEIWNWLQRVGPLLCCWNRGIRKALSATLSLQGHYCSRLRPTSSWPN